MIKLLLTLVILFFSTLSYSTVNIQVIDVEPYGENQYTIAVQIISWDEQDNVPNPCYGASECYIGPDVLYTDKGNPSLSGSCLWENNCIEISQYKTTKEVMEAYRAKKGVPSTSYFKINSGDKFDCTALFYVPRRAQSGNNSDVQMWPGSTCGKIPPLTLLCSVDPIGDIDHGEVSISELQNGKTVLSPIVVATSRCNQDATFTMYATSKGGEQYIPLNAEETLWSEILINGISGVNGAPYSVKANQDTQVTFQSKLFTRGEIVPGNYEGVAVITAAYK